MKKLLGTCLFMFLFLLSGCSEDSVQEELLTYVNEILPEVTVKETAAISAYDSVSGDNYTSDEVMYSVMVDEVSPTYNSFIADLEEVQVESEKIKALHENYIKAANIQHSAFILIISGLEEQDRGKIIEANDKLATARKMIREFSDELETLAEENDVTLEKEY
ncbi:hypothetical protein M4D55_06310 [Metabacillus idriensis]|uniref:hypothetical protein n=1 Tax=Metabacillus idriensis TaxID=324768 RepID=UPI0008A9CDBA|nr:hypothetical protein [Metabacillus idriensis]MCM3595403.1 hypothetical protein [Metabacillus idriensis]OHR72089.1 hypothetical protein HMPREF3291_22730 [Bacillus sp. HMSC76G11]